MRRRVRPIILGIAGVFLIAVAWELYKALAPDTGVVVAGVTVLPRTTDIAMPHIADMIARALEPVTRAPGQRRCGWLHWRPPCSASASRPWGGRSA